MDESVSVEKYRVGQLLDQATVMVTSKMVTAEQAVLLVGNLVDMDLHEPTTVLEHMVFDWLEKMESYYK
ncbi:hypothetical protein [Paenibacillus sp. MMO-177]|uniref:hypothetical protein n=1 Tax=Paenibacillus sp. MMO-177 TaxID=3081289 RepID=UPI0030169597